MAAIYIIEADNTQHKFSLPAEEGIAVTIGSNEDCHIPLPGIEGLSGLHCSVSLVGGEYVITDEGSEGGTLDGERAISSEVLREGVPYSIGAAYLYFDSESVVPSEPLAEDMPAEEPVAVVEEAEEALAEPIPVSEYAEYAQPAAEQEAAAQEPAAPVAAPVKKKKKRKATALSQATLAMATQRRKDQAMSAINYVYVLLVLALAFYGGMTLRHWMETGDYLPNVDSSPAKAVKK